MFNARPYTLVQLTSGSNVSGYTGQQYGRGPVDSQSAIMQHAAAGAAVGSAIITLEGSLDGVQFYPLLTVTATQTTATATYAQFIPIVRARTNAVYSAAGGTGTPSVLWAAP